jgi:SAM-dependent methyltransferase
MQPSPNAESIALWNDVLVPKFIRYRHILVEGLDPHARAALDRHGPTPGTTVLDVGCGFGESTIALAARAAPGGFALGVDCCEGFVSVGRADAARAGVTNLRFEVTDAQTHRFRPGFGLCFSRFGTMFFADPVAAFRNLHRALAPGGRLVMVVWRAREDNDWLALGRKVVRGHLPAAPESPPLADPFALADVATGREKLAAAGFTEIDFERIDAPVMVGRNLDEAVEFQLQIGPAGELVRDAGAEGEALRPTIVAELRRALAAYQQPSGVMMPASSWTVTARAGAAS